MLFQAVIWVRDLSFPDHRRLRTPRPPTAYVTIKHFASRPRLSPSENVQKFLVNEPPSAESIDREWTSEGRTWTSPYHERKTFEVMNFLLPKTTTLSRYPHVERHLQSSNQQSDSVPSVRCTTFAAPLLSSHNLAKHAPALMPSL